jgi:hypothetical protein
MPTDTSGQVIYKEALKYALLTATFFLRNGNFSLALDYLEYAESIARTGEEFLEIKAVLKTAENIVNQTFFDDSTPPPLISPSIDNASPLVGHAGAAVGAAQHDLNLSLANMFYEQNTLGSNQDDFVYEDYLRLSERLQERIQQRQQQEPKSSSQQSVQPSKVPGASPSPLPLKLKPVAVAAPLPSRARCTIS